MYHQFYDRYKRFIPFFIFIVIAILVSSVVYFYRVPEEDLVTVHSNSQQQFQQDQQISPSMVLVDISGAVVVPGVFELEEGSRIKDILEKAGGFTEEADKNYIEKELNQASILSDGQKIYIPSKSETVENTILENIPTGSSKISINNGTMTELDSLWGIGAVRAQDIINNRPYSNIEDLVLRKIIPQSVYDKILNNIQL